MSNSQDNSGTGWFNRVGSTSASLLEQVKANNPEAWRRLCDLYGPLIYQWSRQGGLAPEDSADIVQDVFRSVTTSIERFRKEREGDSFRGWLWTITRNKIRDHHRRRGSIPKPVGGTDAQRRLANIVASEDDPDIASSSFNFSNLSLKSALDRIRDEFQERTWYAFWLSTLGELTTSEIASELEMTSNAVRLAKARVLRRLRKELGEQSDA